MKIKSPVCKCVFICSKYHSTKIKKKVLKMGVYFFQTHIHCSTFVLSFDCRKFLPNEFSRFYSSLSLLFMTATLLICRRCRYLRQIPKQALRSEGDSVLFTSDGGVPAIPQLCS